MSRVLVMESSTSAAKAMVYDREEGILGIESGSFGRETGSGGLHDPGKVFDTLAGLARKVASGHDIEAISLVGIWHGILACDSRMRSCSPAYLWNFPGTVNICRKIRSNSANAHLKPSPRSRNCTNRTARTLPRMLRKNAKPLKTRIYPVIYCHLTRILIYSSILIRYSVSICDVLRISNRRLRRPAKQIIN